MENIIEMIGAELKTQDLSLLPKGNGGYYFSIEYKAGTQLPANIISPTRHYPDLLKSPDRIETACPFIIPDPKIPVEPCFLIFYFQNEVSGEREYLMLKTSGFPVEIINRRRPPSCDGSFEMVIYTLEGNLIYEATDLSAEGMWYYVGRRMGDTIGMDITCHLNRWDKIVDFFKLKN